MLSATTRSPSVSFTATSCALYSLFLRNLDAIVCLCASMAHALQNGISDARTRAPVPCRVISRHFLPFTAFTTSTQNLVAGLRGCLHESNDRVAYSGTHARGRPELADSKMRQELRYCCDARVRAYIHNYHRQRAGIARCLLQYDETAGGNALAQCQCSTAANRQSRRRRSFGRSMRRAIRHTSTHT